MVCVLTSCRASGVPQSQSLVPRADSPKQQPFADVAHHMGLAVLGQDTRLGQNPFGREGREVPAFQQRCDKAGQDHGNLGLGVVVVVGVGRLFVAHGPSLMSGKDINVPQSRGIALSAILRR